MILSAFYGSLMIATALEGTVAVMLSEAKHPATSMTVELQSIPKRFCARSHLANVIAFEVAGFFALLRMTSWVVIGYSRF
jgi:hypothetical protein